MNQNSIRIAGLKCAEKDHELDENQDGVLDSTQAKKKIIERPLPASAGNEITQVIDKLNRDTKDPHSNFSTIDFNADLAPVEVNVYSWHDSLVEFRASPKMGLALTRGLKRHSVSKNRGGRREVASMYTGEKERQASGGLFSRIKDSMQRRKEEKQQPQGQQ